MLTISTKLLPHFKGFCSSAEVIMLFVYMKCRFSLSYRELEEMMMVRGTEIDLSTLQRWVKRFVPLIDKRVRQHKKPVKGSWRMDETYIKLNGKWVYLYRAVDKEGNTIDFLLRARRDAIAAKAFFRKAFKESGHPDKVTVDKSGSNKAALDSFNKDVLKEDEIEIRQIKYLNNIVEQDHRFIKKRTRPTLGFKNFHSAKVTITGIENIRMIQKGQIIGQNASNSSFHNFLNLMA
ncbi:IS6 family transposase [Candidatus Paracaedibacter symbiosus]|uniref:IS6 family transposase n=1 Tax=Candidatus Paracaedibacter symbiosus TaxID=244582 RepID=UPI000509BF4C|nr:IS6 family transposase [Candidatus Paracaedibacter symbiosus]